MAALRLARNPALAKAFRREPLPAGIVRLVQVASSGASAFDPVIHLPGQDMMFLRAAAIFYLEKVLWFEGSDDYRALGLPKNAPADEVAESAWRLMEWLHPYICAPHREAFFAARVLDAWEELKTRLPDLSRG